MKAHLAKVSLALLSAVFLLGCQEQGSEPVGPEGLGPEFNRPDGGAHNHDNDDDGGEFDVTIRTCNALVDETDPASECAAPGNIWTATDDDPTVALPQTVQTNNALNWLHVFDTGGNGTRGRPKYPGAFSTGIFLQPADATSCVNQDGNSIDNANLLFGKLDQTPSGLRVFDFQVNYDIAENPEGFSFFLFRWKDGDRIFSASTGFGFDGFNPAPRIDFLGDPDDIDNPMATRVFRISGAKVIAQELNKNKVIAMVACDNDQIIEVTVAPID